MFVAALCGRDNASCHSPRQERTSGQGPGQKAGAFIVAALGKACFSHLGTALCTSFHSQQSLQCLRLARDVNLPQNLASASQAKHPMCLSPERTCKVQTTHPRRGDGGLSGSKVM